MGPRYPPVLAGSAGNYRIPGVRVHYTFAGMNLRGLNGKPDIDADFSFPDPDPFAPRGRTLTRHLKLWITAHDAPRRRVWAIVDARANQGEKDQRWVFWIDTFDFPMVNFTRVSRSERFTVVLQEYEPESVKAKVRLIYFPSARVGAKDKPFIDDVISDLVHERK